MMAKRFEPFNLGNLGDLFKKTVRAFDYRGQPIARLAVNMPEPSPEWIAEQTLLYSNAKAAWDRLATWKKTRWTLCAYTTWGDGGFLRGSLGYSGFSLYVREWLTQKPASDKQPISPCSARVTDPDASPWNYQP